MTNFFTPDELLVALVPRITETGQAFPSPCLHGLPSAACIFSDRKKAGIRCRTVFPESSESASLLKRQNHLHPYTRETCLSAWTCLPAGMSQQNRIHARSTGFLPNASSFQCGHESKLLQILFSLRPLSMPCPLGGVLHYFQPYFPSICMKFMNYVGEKTLKAFVSMRAPFNCSFRVKLYPEMISRHYAGAC